jgi:hypothetical protein
MPENKVQITIEALNKAQEGLSEAKKSLKDLGDASEKGAKQSNTAWASLKGTFAELQQNWLALTGAFASTYFIAHLVEIGAQALQVEGAFKSLAASSKMDSEAFLASMTRASRGTIDASDVMQTAIKGMTQDLSGDDMIRIMDMARVTAITQGVAVAEAYQRISDSIANELPRGLRAFGLMTKEQLSIVNKAIAAGVEDVDLLGLAYLRTQTKLAQMTLEEKNAMEGVQRLKAAYKDLKEELAKPLTHGFTALSEWLEKWEERFLNFMAKVQPRNEAAERKRTAFALGKIEDWSYGEEINDASRAAEIAFSKQREKTAEDRIKAQTAAAEAAKKHAQELEQLRKEFEKWKEQVDNLNPSLDENAKKMNDIGTATDKFIKGGISKDAVTQWKTRAEFFVQMAERIKNQEEYDEKERKYNQTRVEAAKQYEEQITVYLADELQKRLLAEQEKAKKLRELASKGGADYEAEDAKITARMKKNQAQIRAEFSQRADQARIEAQISEVDRAQKLFQLEPSEAVQQKLTLTKQLLQSQEDYLGTLSETADTTAWRTQADAIEQTRNKFTELNVEAEKYTRTYGEGWARGVKAYQRSMETAFESGEALAKKTAESMETAFGNFLDTTSAGFLDFGKLATQVLADIQRELLRTLVVKPLVGAITGGGGGGGGLAGLLGLIGSFLGGGTGNPMNAPGVNNSLSGWGAGNLAETAFHQGGRVVKLHIGGFPSLKSNEVLSVLEDEEFVIRKEAARKLGPAMLNLVNQGQVPASPAQPGNMTISVPVAITGARISNRDISALRGAIEDVCDGWARKVM